MCRDGCKRWSYADNFGVLAHDADCTNAHLAINGTHFLLRPHHKLKKLARATCRSIVDRMFLSPAVQKRMTGKYSIDVSGGSKFMSRTTNMLGLRGYVLDANFGPLYDVTQLFALTRNRQNVSAGNRVAGMISPPRQQTSWSSKVISASAAIANWLHLACMPWILEHPCGSWLWDVPKIEILAAQLRTAWALIDFCVFVSRIRTHIVSGWKRGQQKWAGTGGRSAGTV